MNFNENLDIKKKEAESIVLSYLPDDEGYHGIVKKAMEYSVGAGGKRLRPILMKECYRLFDGKDKVIEPFMAAIEMIHNYSLVHDDLPAMDNDELRRGKPTTWKQFDECTAILAGDALLNYAFEVSCKAFDMVNDLDGYKRVATSVSVLSSKAGINGMIGGQTADIAAESMNDITEDMLLFIHKNKTAALIEASMMIGAILGKASPKDVSDMERAAENIGLAFQIQDDILDIISTDEELGKPVGSDEKNNKLTYVRLHGLEESKAQVKALSEEAITILQDIADANRRDGSFLMTLVETLINRSK